MIDCEINYNAFTHYYQYRNALFSTRSKNPRAQTPAGAAGRQAPQGGRAENPHGNTTTGKPSPAANAAEAHEPEPRPQKQADDRADGTKPGGHGAAGNTTSPEPGPPAATARTSATDRAANAPRPEPNADAENTTAAGAAARTNASAPAAQPTATERPDANTDPTTPATSGANAGASRRAPENPTTATEQTTAPPHSQKAHRETAPATGSGGVPADSA